MAEFLIRWKLREVAREHSRRLWYSGNDQFEQVKEGDTVWVCTTKRPQRLIVLGPIRVDLVCDLEEAKKRLAPHGQRPYKGRSHHIFTLPRSEALRQHEVEMTTKAHFLEFEGDDDHLPHGWDHEAFQTIRELTPESAAMVRERWTSESPAQAVGVTIEGVTADAETDPFFERGTAEDGLERTLRGIVHRRGQPGLRRILLEAYGKKCAVTGCAVEALLDATQVMPFDGKQTHTARNGMLLRTDLHTLFDLSLITVNAKNFKVHVSPTLADTEYAALAEKSLRLPEQDTQWPDSRVLRAHNDACEWFTG